MKKLAEVKTKKHHYFVSVLGKKHGPYTSFYDNGLPLMSCNYTNGRVNGPFYLYHGNGALRLECFQVNDIMRGQHKVYNKLGKLLADEIFIDNKAVSPTPKTRAEYLALQAKYGPFEMIDRLKN
jgi:antitoxin component YwqK of YwqJK toxin-antitoxin module